MQQKSELESQIQALSQEKKQMAQEKLELNSQAQAAVEEKNLILQQKLELESQIQTMLQEKRQICQQKLESDSQLQVVTEEKTQLLSRQLELELQVKNAAQHKNQLLSSLSNNFLLQKEEWNKQKEEGQQREQTLKAQLTAISAAKDLLSKEIEASSEQIRQYKHRVAQAEWQNGCKDTTIRMQHAVVENHKQKAHEAQRALDTSNHQVQALLARRKVCEFEMGQCLAPLQDLKDVYLDLSEQTRNNVSEWAFQLDILFKHVKNLSQNCIQGAKDLKDTRQELRQLRQTEATSWKAKEADLMKHVAAKQGTYFSRGFEGAVDQCSEQGLLLPTSSLDGLDIATAFKKFPPEAFDTDSE